MFPWQAELCQTLLMTHLFPAIFLCVQILFTKPSQFLAMSWKGRGSWKQHVNHVILDSFETRNVVCWIIYTEIALKCKLMFLKWICRIFFNAVGAWFLGSSLLARQLHQTLEYLKSRQAALKYSKNWLQITVMYTL